MTDAYQMGYDAYAQGFRPWGSCWANPFRPGTPDHEAWEQGLFDAAKEQSSTKTA